MTAAGLQLAVAGPLAQLLANVAIVAGVDHAIREEFFVGIDEVAELAVRDALELAEAGIFVSEIHTVVASTVELARELLSSAEGVNAVSRVSGFLDVTSDSFAVGTGHSESFKKRLTGAIGIPSQPSDTWIRR